MARNDGNTPRNKSKRAAAKRGQPQSKAMREVANQIARMSDADAFAMTFTGNRVVRALAMETCHQRAETFALASER